MGDSEDLEGVAVAVGTEAVRVDGLVAELAQVGNGVEVANRRVHIGRFDWVAGVDLDCVEVLAQANEVPEVLEVAGAPPTGGVTHIRRASNGGEHHIVAADLHGVSGVACVEREFGGRGTNEVHDHLGVETHPVVGDRDRAASDFEQCAGFGEKHVDPDIPQDRQ